VTVTLRIASAEDIDAIWRWRNDIATREASLVQDEIPFDQHRDWYNAVQKDPNRTILIGVLDGVDIGYVRLDRRGDSAWVSVALDPVVRGKGLAVPFLSDAMSACPWPVRRFTAVVRPENFMSRLMVERTGFVFVKDDGPLLFERENLGQPVVVVLANEFAADGTPNDQTDARLDLAATLIADTPEARLVTSGWPYARDPDTPIAALMARAAVARGVDPARISQSPRARDTVGDALFLALDIIGSGPPPSDVTVVTSAYHALRADEVFNFVLKDLAPVLVKTTDEPVTDARKVAELASLTAFHDTFRGIEAGDLPAIQSRLFADHPLYNGQVYGPDSPGVVR